MLHDLALHVVAADARRDPRANGLRDALRHLRQAERLAAEQRRDDRLRHEADVVAVDRKPCAARVVAAGFERDTRQTQRRRVAVALEALAPAQPILVERPGPAEPALERP